MALPQLFSIGEMAKIFHLSVSSLRHYEALGLVTPEYVDPSTNYRYYSVRQFEPLNTIRYLRAMDMPLTEIADFLQNRDVETIEEKLRAQKAAVVQKQKELKRIERKLDARLSQLQDVRHAPLGEITLIHSPALRLFWIDTALTAPRALHEPPCRRAGRGAGLPRQGRLQRIAGALERGQLWAVRRRIPRA